MKWKWNRRYTSCLSFSFFIHLFVITTLCIIFLPAHGSSDDVLVDVGFVSETAAGDVNSEDDVTETKQEEAESLEEEDLEQTVDEETTEEDLESMESAISEQSEEILKVHQQKQKIKTQKELARKNRIAKQVGDIANSIRNRRTLGTLKPRTFYGVNIFAKYIIFVLDISGSMDSYEAKLQLKNAYSDLTDTEYFTIIVFNDRVSWWKEKLQSATQAHKEEADEWVMSLPFGGSTNACDALQKAIEIAKQKPKAESIYFLTDGLPNVGPITNTQEIVNATKKWNNGAVNIHTIGIGHHQDKRFLSALAENNYGKYYER